MNNKSLKDLELEYDSYLEKLSKKDVSELTDNEMVKLWYGNPIKPTNSDIHMNDETFKLYVQGACYIDPSIPNPLIHN